jgi:hypothetical protein
LKKTPVGGNQQQSQQLGAKKGVTTVQSSGSTAATTTVAIAAPVEKKKEEVTSTNRDVVLPTVDSLPAVVIPTSQGSRSTAQNEETTLTISFGAFEPQTIVTENASSVETETHHKKTLLR